MADDDLIRRSDAVAVLLKAQIASCTCETKTPEPDWHRDTCRYRILREAEAMIHHVSPAPLAAALEVPEVRALVEALQNCPPTSNPTLTAEHKIERINAWWKLYARPALAALKAATP